MVELLKQGQYKPLNVVDQIMVIFAGGAGHLDKVPVEEVSRWEDEFLTFIHDKKKDVRDLVDETKNEGDCMKKADHKATQAVVAALDEFNSTFR